MSGDVFHGVPQGSRAFDLAFLRPVWEPIPGLRTQVPVGGKGQVPAGPAPGLPLPGCKQMHAFAVANRRGQPDGGGLLQTKSWFLLSAVRCAGSDLYPTQLQVGRSSHGAPATGQGATRALRPLCPLAPLQIAPTLGPACTPRPLRRPGPICPQALVQSSLDKYTRIPIVPAGLLCLSGARRGSAPGTAPGSSWVLLPGPLQSAPRALSQKAWGVPPEPPTRRPVVPAPGARRPPAAPPGHAERPQGDDVSLPVPPAPCSSSALSPDWQVPKTGAWSARGFGSPEAGAPARVRTGEESCPEPSYGQGGWTVALGPPDSPVRQDEHPKRYLASRLGTRGAPLGPVRSTLLPAELRAATATTATVGMKGARPRPWPAPGPPIPGCPREEGLVGEWRGPGQAGSKGAA